jgi:hypothetical protein
MNARLAAALVVLIALAGTHWKAYDFGKTKIRAEWQAEKLEAESQAEVLRLTRQSSVNRSAKTFATNAAKARQTTQSNLAKVEEYAPSTHPHLPGTFRLWHDAAATGEALDGASGADAPSVPLKEAARTVAENYADARYDQQRLEALQQIVKDSGCFDVGE